MLEQLPLHAVVTLPRVIELLDTAKPTASKAINALRETGILRETTGRKRDRVYAVHDFHDYLRALTRDTE